MKPCIAAAIIVTLAALSSASAQPVDDVQAFRAELLTAVTRHLDQLLGSDGKCRSLKGKSSTAVTAQAYYLLYEATGNPRYRVAAVDLADRILRDMKAMKFGVLYIKEKENSEGKKFSGGGPPAFGWYTANLAYIYHKEGGRAEDLRYIAKVLDEFPWNAQGWWSADIDVNTGVSKQPITKPSPINKNACVALAAGVVSRYIADIDPALSASLKQKTDRCIFSQIIPVLEPDGFWHYNLNGNDPGDKDILGYFMLTIDAFYQLRQFNDAYRQPAFDAALDKAAGFAHRYIAPMTPPNAGVNESERKTRNTPARYTFPADLKRGFEIGLILIESGHTAEGMKITRAALRHFPYGDAGEDAAHAVTPSALMLLALSKDATPR